MELSEIKVIKRDGREVEYDESKVKNAIHNALLDVIIKGNLEDVYLKDDLISFAEMEADDVTCTIINSEKENLDKPLVSIEVKDGRVVQARGMSNRSVTLDEKEYLEKWAKKKGIAYA